MLPAKELRTLSPNAAQLPDASSDCLCRAALIF